MFPDNVWVAGFTNYIKHNPIELNSSDPVETDVNGVPTSWKRTWKSSGVYYCPGWRGALSDDGKLTTYGYNTSGAAMDAKAPWPQMLGLAGGWIPGDGLSALGLTGPIPVMELAQNAVKETAVRSPSEMIALADSFVSRRTGSAAGNAGFEIMDDQCVVGRVRNAPGHGIQANTERTSQRHGKRMNLSFCDGHVELWRLDRFALDDSESVLRRFNRDNEAHLELWR